MTNHDAQFDCSFSRAQRREPATKPAHDRASPLDNNPFDASRIRPGAIPFLFPPGVSAQSLVERLRQNGWWGEIVGAHGSGKSALVAALLPALRGKGRRPILVELHDAQRTLPIDLRQVHVVENETLIVVDGYEQLSRRSRWRLKRSCRQEKLGLLVTTHRSVGLPELCRTEVSPELACRVIAWFVGDRPWGLSDQRVVEVFHRHEGNLREMLFELYDWFEQERRAGP